MRIVLCLPWLLASVLIAQEPDRNPQTRIRDFLGLGPPPDTAAAKLGEPLFKENCATCHGQNARGAQGPNLVRSPLVLHDTKGEEIKPVLKEGRPQGGMPAFPALSDAQIYDIAEFIHLQIELTANRGTYGQTYRDSRNQVTGDPEKGRAFFQANCTGCHSVSGDLAHIGAKYPQASVMVTRIAWPVSTQPKQATVTLSNGELVTGTLMALNDFDVSLRDSAGEYRSWPRNQVQVKLQDNLAGHRVLLPKYTDDDLHNLTAFLVSLK